jgi:hypothetical protein
MSNKVRTPINAHIVKQRAEKKMQEMIQSNNGKLNQVVITGNLIKPIRVSKNDPSVKRILGLQD